MEKFKLLNKDFQEYFIDHNSKAPIAITRRKDKKIYVNNEFEKLSPNEKIAIIYHERGHSKFFLWKPLLETTGVFFSLAMMLIFFPVFFLILNYYLNNLIFQIPNLIWGIFVILGILFFFTHTLIYWLLEIIADINSVSRIDKKYLIEIIEKEYGGRKISFWNKYITHPPWKLRKKILNGINKNEKS